ncbi:hypothetical protein DL93DRAFT_2082373 [Clavulina sp. PMI_390]|nr:hypothetical protein DL93DRAFT_2082373 [Clavulina sp. PMI_390]
MGKESDVLPTEMLLPMPSDGSEALDRVWLFHSVYVTDQVVGTLTATPGNFICDERWEPTRVSEHNSARYPWLQVCHLRII